MHFDPESIKQGRANQDASVETPESFATLDGATQPVKVLNCLKAIAVWQERWVLVLWN